MAPAGALPSQPEHTRLCTHVCVLQNHPEAVLSLRRRKRTFPTPERGCPQCICREGEDKGRKVHDGWLWVTGTRRALEQRWHTTISQRLQRAEGGEISLSSALAP